MNYAWSVVVSGLATLSFAISRAAVTLAATSVTLAATTTVAAIGGGRIDNRIEHILTEVLGLVDFTILSL